MTAPQLYRTTITHQRTRPATHGFRYRHTMWLVDLDALPQVPRPFSGLLRFDARDHLGDPSRSIRANVDAFLAGRGVERPRRIVMLANPRSFGHAFNPLSVYWCYWRDEELHAIVAEVHNTYGERHCYLLRPDGAGRAEAGKEMYVSPFFPVDGRYEMRFTEPGDHLDLAITLQRPDGAAPVFRATLTARDPVVVGSALAAALRHPAASWWVSVRIRFQGVRLWLRRLPVVPRPVHAEQEGV